MARVPICLALHLGQTPLYGIFAVLNWVCFIFLACLHAGILPIDFSSWNKRAKSLIQGCMHTLQWGLNQWPLCHSAPPSTLSMTHDENKMKFLISYQKNSNWHCLSNSTNKCYWANRTMLLRLYVTHYRVTFM